jgi:hypothetical protein
MNKKAPEKSAGHWPNPFKQFYWDLLPGKFAPEDSGIKPPLYKKQIWLDKAPEGALEHAIRAHDQAEARAMAAQDKGARLLNLSLTLLGVSFALAGWQNAFIQKRGYGWWLFSIVPIVFSIFFLSIAALDALEIDRVGVFHQPGVESLESETSRLEVEDYGRMVANWTARRKLSLFLQARAWLSRGLLCLFTAALISAFCAGFWRLP